MGTDHISTDDVGAEQQQVLDAFADLIELAQSIPEVRINGSIPRQILEAAREAYDDLGTVMIDDMVGPRPIEDLPALTHRSALADIAAERLRQVEQEGWTPEHDDQHNGRQMAKAAACYASFAGLSDRTRGEELYAPGSVFTAWPWQPSWWKPTSPRRDLVKAAALILAEIERLDRAEAKAGNHG